MILAIRVMADAGTVGVPFQFILCVGISGIFVGAARIAGRVLQNERLRQIWYSSTWVSISIIGISFVIVFFGRAIGITTTVTSPEFGASYQDLHPFAGFGSMFAAVFATLHWSSNKAAT